MAFVPPYEGSLQATGSRVQCRRCCGRGFVWDVSEGWVLECPFRCASGWLDLPLIDTQALLDTVRHHGVHEDLYNPDGIPEVVLVPGAGPCTRLT